MLNINAEFCSRNVTGMVTVMRVALLLHTSKVLIPASAVGVCDLHVLPGLLGIY